MAKKQRIRVMALVVFQHGGRILVGVSHDDVKQQTFYRPLGGGIKFGERADAAAAREIREELNAAIRDVRLLGVVQNIFTYEGQPGHEILFIYDAMFVDPSFYQREELVAQEDDRSFPARWIDPHDTGGVPLYPDELVSVLDRV